MPSITSAVLPRLRPRLRGYVLCLDVCCRTIGFFASVLKRYVRRLHYQRHQRERRVHTCLNLRTSSFLVKVTWRIEDSTVPVFFLSRGGSGLRSPGRLTEMQVIFCPKNVAPLEPSRTILLGRGSLLRCKSPLSFFTTMPQRINFMLLTFHGSDTLANKDTFEPELHVTTNFYVPSHRASRRPLSAHSSITMILYCHNTVAKERSSATNVFSDVRTAMIQNYNDLVVGVFTGASWYRKVGADQQDDSTLEDAFKNARLRCHLAPLLCWALEASCMNGLSYADLSTPQFSISGLFSSTVRLSSTVKNGVYPKKED